MRSKRFIAAALAAVTVFGYSAGHFPAGLIKPANTITAEAANIQSAKRFDSLGYPDSTDLNTFYGYMNTYFDYENIAYDSTTSVRSIRIKGFKTNDKQIEIPAPYYDLTSGLLYSITEIGRDYSYDLKELEIPETVEKIGACAFQNTGLESLYIPYGVKSLTSSNGASYNFKTTNSEFYRTEPFTPQLKTLYIPPTLSYDQLKDMEFGDYEVFNNYSFDNQTYPVTLYGVEGSGAERYANEHSNVTFKSMEDLTDYYVSKVEGETPVTYRYGGITYYISDTIYPPPTFTLTYGSNSYSSTSSALSCSFDGDETEIRWYDVKFADRTKGYGSKRVYFTSDPKWYTCQPGNSYSHEYNYH